MKDCAQTTATMLKAEVDRTTAAMTEMVAEAKTAATVLIEEAGEQITERFQRDAAAAVQPLLRQLQAERLEVERSSRRARQAGWLAAGCAALTAAGLAPWLLQALRTML